MSIDVPVAYDDASPSQTLDDDADAYALLERTSDLLG
jgi:hypothetical protein